MRSSLRIILLFSIVAMLYQSCDSTLNIDKPKDFYKYIGLDGNQTAVDLVTDADGNAYILGSSTIASETQLGQQLYVVMTNPNGEVVWSKIYGDNGDDVPKDIEMLSDGTLVILADRSDGEFAVYHLDRASGLELAPFLVSGLEKLLSLPAGTSDDHANSITQTDDGFIVAGYVNQGTYKTALIARYYADMTSYPNSWEYQVKLFDDAAGYNVVPIKVVQKDANTFAIFGYTNVPGTDATADNNYFIVSTGSTDVAITPLWSFEADTIAHSDDRLVSVQQVPVQSGGGFILTGYTSSRNGSTQDIFITRVTQDFTSAKSRNDVLQGRPKTITSNLSSLSAASLSLCSSSFSGFYVLANQGVAGDNNLYLTKLGSDLSNAWGDDAPGKILGGVGDDMGGAVAETADGRILVVGTMVLGDLKGQRKIVLMNLNSDGLFGN